MRINHLLIQGFRSFAAPVELDFAAMQPGLYHVTGTNMVEPELEGNGVGKSSLFEAIFWILNGTTSRGLKAGNVQHWSSKERCAGVLDVAQVGTVFRSWQPNALELSDAPVDQATLEAAVGMGPDTMLRAIYFSQFAPAFADLRPAEQTLLFSNILELHVWDAAAAMAAAREGAAQLLITDTQEQLARLEGEAQALLAEDHTAMADAWDEEQAVRVREVASVCHAVQEEVKALKVHHAAAVKAAGGFRQLREQGEAKARECGAAEALVRRQEKEIDALELEMRAKDMPAVCRTCGQKLPAKQVRQHIRDDLRTKAAELATLTADSERLHAEHGAITKQMYKHRAAEVRATEAHEALTAAQGELRAAEQQQRAVTGEVNPYAQLAARAEQRGQQLVVDMELCQQALLQLHTSAEAAKYWVRGFREVRLALIRETLGQLEIEANEALFQLGLQDWALSFHVERENKSGGITNKFGVMVKAPHTEEPVPWEAWSGGESQRLRLSCSMGVANLICSRAGIQPNLEFWDEPTQWLGASGIQALLQVLADRAQRLGKVILLADHRSLEFGGFAGTIHLVKDAAGSRIVPPV